MTRKEFGHVRRAVLPFMRFAMATMVTLLILNFVDEQYNVGRYTRAATVVLSQIARSFG